MDTTINASHLRLIQGSLVSQDTLPTLARRHNRPSYKSLLSPSTGNHVAFGYSLAGEYKTQGFISTPLPPAMLAISAKDTITLLNQCLGPKVVAQALNVDTPTNLSPLAKTGVKDPRWIHQSHIVGMHPRVLGSFFNMVKYALTLSPEQDALHILPILEPDTDMYGNRSLYGPINWQLNAEFFDPGLAQAQPHLNTPEKQLKATVNLLHAMGKKVGIDMVQHTAVFSEVALANPDCFEWYLTNATHRRFINPVSRKTAHSPLNQDHVSDLVKPAILKFLETHHDPEGKVIPPSTLNQFFTAVPEAERLALLFGPPHQPKRREQRRKALINTLTEQGFLMASQPMVQPYRPMRLAHPTHNGGKFPKLVTEGTNLGLHTLTPFKLYHLHPDGSLNLHQPNKLAWNYAIKHYKHLVDTYNFDFMRADMAHIQPWPDIPYQNPYYHLYGSIKHAITTQKPYFAYFGEDFPSDNLGFRTHRGVPNTEAHFKEARMDCALGYLPNAGIRETSETVRTTMYHRRPPQYSVTMTMMTADSDGTEFGGRWEAYNTTLGNTVRAFIGFFLPPSYMGVGFELRGDVPPPLNPDSKRPLPKDMRALTHWFIIRGEGEAYQWGNNPEFYQQYTKLRQVLHTLAKPLQNREPMLLPTNNAKLVAWVDRPRTNSASTTNKKGESASSSVPQYVFIVNSDLNAPHGGRLYDADNRLHQSPPKAFKLIYSSELKQFPVVLDSASALQAQEGLRYQYDQLLLKPLAPGEARIYQLLH